VSGNSEDERGHQGTARYPIHKHRERHGMRPVRTHTRNYRPSSSQVKRTGSTPLLAHIDCPGEPTTSGKRPRHWRLPTASTTLPDWGHEYCQQPPAAGTSALPANHQRPPPDVSERAGCRASQGACAVPSHVLDLAGAQANATGRMSTRALSLSYHHESLLSTGLPFCLLPCCVAL